MPRSRVKRVVYVLYGSTDTYRNVISASEGARGRQQHPEGCSDFKSSLQGQSGARADDIFAP